MKSLLNLFSVDYWSNPTGHDTLPRPKVLPKTAFTGYRPHDRGRGQEFRDNYYWTIPFKQQKTMYMRNSWVKKCIDHIASQASNLEWRIYPKMEYIHLLEHDERLINAIIAAKSVFNRRNKKKMNFRRILRAVIRDLKIMDAACIEKVRDSNGLLVALNPFDAAHVKKDVDERGQILGYVQDLTESMVTGRQMGTPDSDVYRDNAQNTQFVRYDPDDIIYMQLVDRTESPYGSSAISSLIDSLYADLATDVNLYHFLSTGGVNRGFLNVGPHVNIDDIEKIRDAFRRYQNPGMIHTLPIFSVSENVEFQPISVTNTEAQMHELQQSLRNKILAVLSIPPNELGLSGAERGQVYSQKDVFWAGIITMMSSIAEYFTEEILAEFDPRLEFVFLPPEEHQFESELSRVITMEEQGYIDEELIPIYLGINKPKHKPYIKRKKELELESLELQVNGLRRQDEIQSYHYNLLRQQPQLQHTQMLAQTKMLVDQANTTDEQAQLQLQQMEMQKTQLEMQQNQLSHEKDLSEGETEIRKLEIAVQLIGLQQQMNSLQSQAPQQGLNNQDIVSGILNGQISTGSLSQMIQNGEIDPDQIKQITSSERVVNSMFKSMPNGDILQAIKPVHNEKVQYILDPKESSTNIASIKEDKMQKPLDIMERVESIKNIGTARKQLMNPLQNKSAGGKNYVRKELLPASLRSMPVLAPPKQDEQEKLEIQEGDMPQMVE